MIDELRCKEQGTFSVLAWGGSSLRVIHIQQNEQVRLRIVCRTLEHAAPDWIYDICPAHIGDNSSLAYLITGHNSVMSIKLKEVENLKYSHTIQLRRLISGVKSTLYSADIVALSSSHILIAAGTVFGEIIVWSCFRGTAADTPNVTSSIHHFFTGHDGSIFGVSISDELRLSKAGKEHRVRLLASCSDDRTVRIWDISDCIHTTATDRAAYVTDGFDLRSTGFGSTAPKNISSGSESAVAKGWGHSSRVWGVYFLPVRGDCVATVNLVSKGEDATSQLWRLDSTYSESNKSLQYELSNISSLSQHAGKHIWSLAFSKGDGDSQLLYTGGNDGAVRTYELAHIERSDDGKELPTDSSPYCPRTLLKAEYSKIDTGSLAPRSFDFVSNDTLLVVNASGLVQLGTFTNAPGTIKPQVQWETLSIEEDLRSLSTISSLPSCGLAIIGGSTGNLRLYNHSTKNLTNFVQVPRRPVKIVMLNAEVDDVTGLPRSFKFLVGYPQHEEAHLFKVEMTADGYNVTKTNLVIPPSFTIATASFVCKGECLAVGGKMGQLLLYCLDPGKENLETSFAMWRAHEREFVNFVQSMDDETSDTGYVLTGGGDGHYCVWRLYRQSEGDSRWSLQRIHRSSAPLTKIEGAYFDDQTGQFILYGFRGVAFVLWNETTQTQILTLDCGGVNRVWKFMPNPTNPEAGTIVWIQARALHAIVADSVLHRPLQMGGHGREQKTLAVSKAGNHGGPLIASGGEDTMIRISVPLPRSKDRSSTWNSVQCLRIMSAHVSGLQQIKWSDDGRFLFSSAGREEFMAWRLRSVPRFGASALLEAACPREELDIELRVTSFDVLRMEPSADEDKFLVALVYSNSTIKVSLLSFYDESLLHKQIFSYRSSKGAHTYELLGRGTYSTNCLTEVHFMVRESKVLLVTGATDGYIAVWPVDWITPEESGRFSVNVTSDVQPLKWELHHAVHTSSIKTLEHEEILPGYQMLLSGGDDNSLSVTLVKLDDVCVVSSICVTNAHASAITAVKILSCHTDTATKIEIASSGNDQRVKLWSVVVDLEKQTWEQMISISLRTDRYSPVADIAAMDDMEIVDTAGTTKRVVVVGGVGLEMLTI